MVIKSGQSTMTPQIVAFVGLPSAGKSTLINALTHKRLLQTGVCRTTKEVHLIGEQNLFNFSLDRFHEISLTSDDGVPMTILDLPGLAAAENKGTEKNFNELTDAWITHSNIIFWVSDLKSAFMTTHEKQEFDNVVKMLKKSTDETGTLYQVAILLSKYEHIDIQPTGEKQRESKNGDGEIVDVIEDTTILDCHKRVTDIFKDTDIPIFKFNAFGRILHSKKSSQSLLQLVNTLRPCVPNTNCQFNLQWAIKDIAVKQQFSFLKCLFNFHFKNMGSHNCPCGVNIHSLCGNTASAPCACNGYCACGGAKCSVHGTCSAGKNKLTDDSCPSGNNCKYHRTDKCLYGTVLDGKAPCGNVNYCPQHQRMRMVDIRETANKITNPELLKIIIDFLFVSDPDSYTKFCNMTSCDTKTINKILFGLADGYNVGNMNAFASVIGKRPEFDGIVDKMVNKNDIMNPDVLYRLIQIVGVDNLNVTRMYLNSTNNCSSKSMSAYPNISFPCFKSVTELDRKIHSQYMTFDVDMKKNKNCVASRKWMKSLAEFRRQLWGEDEDDINVDHLPFLLNISSINSMLQHIV